MNGLVKFPTRRPNSIKISRNGNRENITNRCCPNYRIEMTGGFLHTKRRRVSIYECEKNSARNYLFKYSRSEAILRISADNRSVRTVFSAFSRSWLYFYRQKTPEVDWGLRELNQQLLQIFDICRSLMVEICGHMQAVNYLVNFFLVALDMVNLYTTFSVRLTL